MWLEFHRVSAEENASKLSPLITVIQMLGVGKQLMLLILQSDATEPQKKKRMQWDDDGKSCGNHIHST